jgi:hypothetical protein
MSPPPGFDPQTIQPVASRYYYNKIMTNMAEVAFEATARIPLTQCNFLSAVHS